MQCWWNKLGWPPGVGLTLSDWFCPACRRTEPAIVQLAIVQLFPKIAAIAKVGFVDIPVHPETSNFTPYNTQFLVHEKGKYLELRGALNKLALKTKTPSPEDVQKVGCPLGSQAAHDELRRYCIRYELEREHIPHLRDQGDPDSRRNERETTEACQCLPVKTR